MAEGVRLLAALRQDCRHRASWLLDITTDFAIPCVAAVSVNADGRGLACGLAARLALKEAVRAAVLEMCQMELAFPIAASKMRQRGEAALNATDRRHLARATEIDANACDLLHPLGPPRGIGPRATGSSGDALVILRDAFACRGIEAVLVDLGRAEFDIPVVQAVAPRVAAHALRIANRKAQSADCRHRWWPALDPGDTAALTMSQPGGAGGQSGLACLELANTI